MKKFFVEVTFYSPCNVVAEELCSILKNFLHQFVVTEDKWPGTLDAIGKTLESLYKMHPRCKPFNVKTFTSRDMFGNEMPFCRIFRNYEDEQVVMIGTKMVMGCDPEIENQK